MSAGPLRRLLREYQGFSIREPVASFSIILSVAATGVLLTSSYRKLKLDKGRTPEFRIWDADPREIVLHPPPVPAGIPRPDSIQSRSNQKQ
ncbi:hypothetical protein PROFUN_09381 [Planoprotostelium fungivorum]|uniref:Uncharacterized protein n=1 Tax=Planoprotostelium fungivorum TaxID=1890364 RepID=A0A2P6NGY7_9EUKA|nr:hypothetical protein PROFUN_09381 [Planoprotostelium fungivorum]